MTTSSSAASVAAAAQGEHGKGFPAIAPLAVILATIATGVYILLKDDDGDGRRFVEGLAGGSLFGEPISPD